MSLRLFKVRAAVDEDGHRRSGAKRRQTFESPKTLLPAAGFVPRLQRPCGSSVAVAQVCTHVRQADIRVTRQHRKWPVRKDGADRMIRGLDRAQLDPAFLQEARPLVGAAAGLRALSSRQGHCLSSGDPGVAVLRREVQRHPIDARAGRRSRHPRVPARLPRQLRSGRHAAAANSKTYRAARRLLVHLGDETSCRNSHRRVAPGPTVARQRRRRRQAL
jgi:hypothetical protein